MATSPQRVYFVEDGQTDVVLDIPYVLGGSLQVFINGMLAVVEKDYVEVDPVTIHFLYQLSSTDVIITQQQDVALQNVTVINNSPRPSLFKTFGTEQTLLPNQEYTFTLINGEQEFTSKFFTLLDPFYSTVEIIRNDLGPIAEPVADDRIQLLIHNNSILSLNIASEENMALLEEEEKTPYVFKQFVRYRTELDLVMNMYLYLTGNQGRVSKILGELEIEREMRFSNMDMEQILGDLKKKLAEWEKLLRGYQAKTIAASAVRGGVDSYPLNNPRREFGTGTTSG